MACRGRADKRIADLRRREKGRACPYALKLDRAWLAGILDTIGPGPKWPELAKSRHIRHPSTTCLWRGRSSVGRAPQSHCGGQGFKSPRLHQPWLAARASAGGPAKTFTSTSNRLGTFRAGYSAACWAPNGDQWVLCNREITAQMRYISHHIRVPMGWFGRALEIEATNAIDC